MKKPFLKQPKVNAANTIKKYRATFKHKLFTSENKTIDIHTLNEPDAQQIALKYLWEKLPADWSLINIELISIYG